VLLKHFVGSFVGFFRVISQVKTILWLHVSFCEGFKSQKTEYSLIKLEKFKLMPLNKACLGCRKWNLLLVYKELTHVKEVCHIKKSFLTEIFILNSSWISLPSEHTQAPGYFYPVHTGSLSI